MFKFLLLAVLFVALVPGVVLNLNFGSKNKWVPLLVHGAIFAFIYSVASHAYWARMKHKHAHHVRQMNQELTNRVHMGQIAMVQMNQMVQNEVLNNLVVKCEGHKA
jgi:hypothetical protein